MAKNFTSEITSFLGLHEPNTDTLLKIGESPKMKNLKITESHTLALREGFHSLESFSGEARGIICFEESVFYVAGNTLYRRQGEVSSSVGILESDIGKICFFPYGEKLYILDGVKIKVWQEDTLSDLEPYIPLIAVSTDCMGGGIAFEEINLLTPKRRQSFTLDPEHRELHLAEKEITSVICVKYQGEELQSNSYTADTALGVVTLKNAPSGAVPNAYEVTYSKESEGSDLIHRMRYAALWGGDNDTRIFLWGDRENPAIYRYSGVHDGMSGMEYFPELSFNKTLSGSKVTSLIRHYDRLLIFTENDAYYSYIETNTDGNGKNYLSFPVRTLSSVVGCSEENCAVLALNSPITLYKGSLYRWLSTTVRDEKNAEDIGGRIKSGLSKMIEKGVSVFDREGTGELYLWNEGGMYVYNYALDLFYCYEGIDAAGFAEDKKGNVYFLERSGALSVFDSSGCDNGEKIKFHWETGYEDTHGLDTKNIHSLEFELLPMSESAFHILWVSDNATSKAYKIGLDYKVFDMNSLLFDIFSFKTSVTPVRLYKRVKLKRCRGFKLIIKSGSDNGDFHLLSLRIKGSLTNTK